MSNGDMLGYTPSTYICVDSYPEYIKGKMMFNTQCYKSIVLQNLSKHLCVYHLNGCTGPSHCI